MVQADDLLRCCLHRLRGPVAVSLQLHGGGHGVDIHFRICKAVLFRHGHISDDIFLKGRGRLDRITCLTCFTDFTGFTAFFPGGRRHLFLSAARKGQSRKEKAEGCQKTHKSFLVMQVRSPRMISSRGTSLQGLSDRRLMFLNFNTKRAYCKGKRKAAGSRPGAGPAGGMGLQRTDAAASAAAPAGF